MHETSTLGIFDCVSCQFHHFCVDHETDKSLPLLFNKAFVWAGLAQHWDVMGPPSFQLAMYPGDAARYVRHADASDSSPARSFTAIYYLNPGMVSLQLFTMSWVLL